MKDSSRPPGNEERPGTLYGSRARMRNALDRLMRMKRVVEVEEDKSVRQLMNELQLSSAPVLLAIEGEVFRPDQVPERRLKKGDKVAVIPIIVGG